ncbi:MAG: hypothetical protein KJZ47_14875, partial [Gemmatimonadales bacterium]|nr:hypothetical protein [Gemmatimonadales bacterium]
MTRGLLLVVATLAASPLAAQDPVRVGIDYRPGIRPRVVILPAVGLDSVRSIVGRDLDYSDRFEVVVLPQAEPAASPLLGGQPPALNYELYRSLSASWAVQLERAAGGMALTVRLHDLTADVVRRDTTLAVDISGAGEGRMDLHRLSDALVEWISGQRGIAATRFLYVERGSQRIHRVDSDGHAVVPMSPGGATALAPQWSPDGSKFTY